MTIEKIVTLVLLGLALILPPNLLAKPFANDFVQAAIERTFHHVRYDGAYVKLDYPNGDVPADTGVCSDVIIRSYRSLGIDLQKLIHEDMLQRFNEYPSKRIWGLTKPDKNIDHRRVPNLQTFFKKFGEKLTISNKKEHYQAGELVTWMLSGNLPHIGIVTNQINPETGNPMIVHNIGRGPKLEDMLFSYQITGHYRYIPAEFLEN